MHISHLVTYKKNMSLRTENASPPFSMDKNVNIFMKKVYKTILNINLFFNKLKYLNGTTKAN